LLLVLALLSLVFLALALQILLELPPRLLLASLAFLLAELALLLHLLPPLLLLAGGVEDGGAVAEVHVRRAVGLDDDLPGHADGLALVGDLDGQHVGVTPDGLQGRSVEDPQSNWHGARDYHDVQAG